MVERSVRDVERASSDVAPTSDQEEPSGRRFPRFARRTSPAPLPQGDPRKSRPHPRFQPLNVLGRIWIPLVITIVIVAGGFTVWRVHGIFGSEKRLSYADTKVDDNKPFNPKHLVYEVFGPPGTVAEISYFDVNGEPQHIAGAPLPWSLDMATTKATLVADILAQGNGDYLGCRILVDKVVKVEKVMHEVNAFTYCMLKAA